MSDGKVTARVSVLHAAILLPVFTVERVALFTGLPVPEVRWVLDGASDVIERTPTLGEASSEPAVFRLVASMRQAVCLEVVQATARLRGEREPDSRAVQRSIDVVLNAAEGSLEEAHCQTFEDSSPAEWLSRAREQLKLAGRLLRLAPDFPGRSPLNVRAQALLSRLAAMSSSEPRAQLGS